jgi:peptide chain release factor 1
LDNESGGLRLQRCPPTERKGRIHTSTVTIAIIDPTIPQFSVRDEDLKVEWYSGTGSGGQFRNKHQNSCRITHIPTGAIATSQTRARSNSYKLARADIEKRIIDQQTTILNKQISVDRKCQVGSGMRGDKIRTIRFQDNSAVDHITGKRTTAERFMKGYMDLLWL